MGLTEMEVQCEDGRYASKAEGFCMVRGFVDYGRISGAGMNNER